MSALRPRAEHQEFSGRQTGTMPRLSRTDSRAAGRLQPLLAPDPDRLTVAGEPLGQDDRHHPERFSQTETEPPSLWLSPAISIRSKMNHHPGPPSSSRLRRRKQRTPPSRRRRPTCLGQPLQPPSIDAAGRTTTHSISHRPGPDATWYVRSSSGNQYGPADSASLAVAERRSHWQGVAGVVRCVAGLATRPGGLR